MTATIQMDWTISLGVIMHLFGMVMAIVGFWIALDRRLTKLEVSNSFLYEMLHEMKKNMEKKGD